MTTRTVLTVVTSAVQCRASVFGALVASRCALATLWMTLILIARLCDALSPLALRGQSGNTHQLFNAHIHISWPFKKYLFDCVFGRDSYPSSFLVCWFYFTYFWSYLDEKAVGLVINRSKKWLPVHVFLLMQVIISPPDMNMASNCTPLGTVPAIPLRLVN